MSKSVIINQPFGLGDCIFAQGVAHYYMAGGYKVYWPVKQLYLNDLRRAYPTVNWMHENMFHDGNDAIRYDLLHALYAPIFWGNTFTGQPYHTAMRAKYDMYGLDWKTWRNHAQWKRDVFKEEELFEMHNINKDSKFNLISRKFGGGSFDQIKVDVPEPHNGLNTIFIKQMDGYSLFDWAPMMAAATTIHFVSSSNIYLLEMMDLKATEIHLYPREPRETDHKNYEYILERHKYILH